MRVAVSTDGDSVSAHFGRCPEFTIADIENGKVVKKEIVPNPGHSPGAIPQFLSEKGVQVIIAGGMGQRAAMFFNQFKIEQVVGINGGVDEVLSGLARGTLKGGESLCNPGSGRGYGLDKTVCDHPEEKEEN